jgi:ribosomal protein S12 methylthiotransferase
MVVVNTCGFIDAAVEESLDSIGESLAYISSTGTGI